MRKSSSHNEAAFTLVEMLVTLLILSVLAGIGTVVYRKQREAAIDRTVHSDIRNYSSFMREEYIADGHFPDEISDSFENWSRENDLVLTTENSCIEGTTPEYGSVFWRYSLVDNTVSQEPCPPPPPEFLGDNQTIPDEEDDTPEGETPPPLAGPGGPPGPGEELDEENLGFIPAYVMTADPILFTGFNNHATNNLRLDDDGDLLVEGNFECNSNVVVTGTVIVTGNAYLTNNCLVEGNLWVGGDLRMNSTPHIKGDIEVRGNISTQSTVTVDGNIWVRGTLTSNDGRTVEQLKEMGAIGGEVEEGSFIPPYQARDFPVNKVNGTLTTWSNWMKQQASYYNTPSWSPVAQGSGCIMSPGQSWSLPGDILVKNPTNVDARACNEIRIDQGGTIRLEADLTLFVKSFSASNGIHFVSADGKPHKVNIVVPTAGDTPNRVCGSSGHINLGSDSTGDENIHVVIYTESRVTMGGNTSFRGEIMSGCTTMWGNVKLTNPDGR